VRFPRSGPRKLQGYSMSIRVFVKLREAARSGILEHGAQSHQAPRDLGLSANSWLVILTRGRAADRDRYGTLLPSQTSPPQCLSFRVEHE